MPGPLNSRPPLDIRRAVLTGDVAELSRDNLNEQNTAVRLGDQALQRPPVCQTICRLTRKADRSFF
jgi:hypothetical protein